MNQRIFLQALFPVPDDPLPERRQKFIDGLRFRAIVSSAFAVVFILLGATIDAPELAVGQLLAVLAALAGVNVLYWLLAVSTEFSLRQFYFHWLVDLFLISMVLYLLGGVDVPYGFLAYVMIVVTSATFLSQRASFIVAIGATLATLIMGSAQLFGLIDPPRVWSLDVSYSARIASVTFAIVFYFVFAYLSGTLADQLKRANQDLNRARDQIQRQNRMLEAKVAERTRELEGRNAEIEEFVHVVTHDLKNVSIGATETARRLIALEAERFSSRARRYADHLLEDTRSMNEMLLHLLRIFRMDREGRDEKPVNIGSVARDILKGHEARIEAKRVRATIGEMPTVVVDETQMRHVLTNLLDNAIKYVGDKGDPWITIFGEESPNEWIIGVEDNGIGIPESQQDRIFQLYHRGPDQEVGGVTQQGEGVGLAMSKRIIERWGGRIWFESDPGVGTCFKFSVPRPIDA